MAINQPTGKPSIGNYTAQLKNNGGDSLVAGLALDSLSASVTTIADQVSSISSSSGSSSSDTGVTVNGIQVPY